MISDVNAETAASNIPYVPVFLGTFVLWIILCIVLFAMNPNEKAMQQDKIKLLDIKVSTNPINNGLFDQCTEGCGGRV